MKISLLLRFLFAILFFSSSIISGIAFSSAGLHIKDYINSNGSINPKLMPVGSYDVFGYKLRIDNHLGIIASFEPNWSALGDGVNYGVRAIAVDNIGNVYVTGEFTQAGGIDVNYVAKWDGTTWSALGDGLNDDGYAIIVDEFYNVYVGGLFTQAGGIDINYLAKWDGTTWSALGGGLSAACLALVNDNIGNIYASGNFSEAEGISVNFIAKWNGTNWSALGEGLNSGGEAVTIDNIGNLYVAGHFTAAGGISASYVAKWNGTTWSALGAGMNDRCYAIEADSLGNVYVGGKFQQISGADFDYIAKWDGVEWSGLSGLSSWVRDIAINSDGKVYVIGGASSSGFIAKRDSLGWAGLEYDSSEDYAITIDDNDNVFVGGTFSNVGGNFSCPDGIPANNIAKWVEGVTTNNFEILQASEIRIYPNPTNDKLYLDGLTYENAKVSIVDLTGKTFVFQEDWIESLDISHLQNGTYFLTIFFEGKIYKNKFIKL